MTQFVLIELCSFDKVLLTEEFPFWVDFYFNLTADSTCSWIVEHVLIQLLKGVFIRSCTNIQHHGELRLDVLTDGKEEPLMGVDFTIISLLNTEHEIDTTALEELCIDTEVPCRHLENMQ